MKKSIPTSQALDISVKNSYLLFLVLLPKSLISKVFGIFASLQLPGFLMMPILKTFIKMYKINLNEAELELGEYRSLNQFFSRGLKHGVRLIDQGKKTVVSPVDGRISVFGEIKEDTMLQAKGINYSLKELLGSEQYLEFFRGGNFITIYLSPNDYHRIHTPFAGKILGYTYKPGKLFPVNELAVNGIKSLFPKNERLITFIQTEFGKIAVIKVGALNVGRIKVTYDKIVTNSWVRLSRNLDYKNAGIAYEKGEELGRFEMGSTVILVFEKGTFSFGKIEQKQKIQLGSVIGSFKAKR